MVAAALITYATASTYIVWAGLQTRDVCPPGEGPPTDLRVEAVAFSNRADRTRLAGWLAPAPGDRGIILVHGIDSDAWAGAQVDLTRAYVDAGFTVLLFDLRAHGRSDGEHLSLGSLERGDVRAAVDVLLDRGLLPGRIGLHGTSYGAALSILAAAEIAEIGAVIADSAYADPRDLMASQVERRTRVPGFIAASLLRPGIEGAARLLYGLDLAALAPERVVARIAPRPVLFIHGELDSVVPQEHAKRLNDHAANAAAELWILDGMRHTAGARSGPCNRVPSPGRAAFLARIVSFFDAALSGTRS